TEAERLILAVPTAVRNAPFAATGSGRADLVERLGVAHHRAAPGCLLVGHLTESRSYFAHELIAPGELAPPDRDANRVAQTRRRAEQRRGARRVSAGRRDARGRVEQVRHRVAQPDGAVS